MRFVKIALSTAKDIDESTSIPNEDSVHGHGGITSEIIQRCLHDRPSWERTPHRQRTNRGEQVKR